ncbi:MAG: hypothetical protein QNJ72_23505, partial [Pleurocapsa sp. MO_226.B13]|nr:hypothetical protein [Pleurocapsa sp. MO_226.B13]
MQSQTYKWKRYWCSRSGKINLPDRGFVSDPEGKYGNIFNPDLVRFSSILSVPCLVFLGEPGIGKSSTIKVERSWFENRIKNENDEIIFLDLRSYGSEDRLVKKLFNCNKFNQWVNGSHNLHIFLDSLDECLLRIDTVATLLIDELSEYSDFLDRLYFRIACRTAVWPTVLEEGLNDIWTNDYNSNPNPVQVYELAPLLQVNVEEAAKTEGINPKLFIEEVITKNLAPLAIKPVTLKFLIKIFKRHNSSFPINQRLYDFYLEGCFCLCEEINQSRLSSQNNSKDLLDRDRRLVIASRIAAATVFGNRFAIWTGIEQDNVLDENVLLRDLCFGTEIINDNEVEVTRDVIKEVLDTGLFSSRGSSQISWAHQTYAEFLAAWYLIHCQVKLDTIRQLIIHPDDSEKRVIPQLSETVAWLSSMNSEVFSMVMKTDPDILLFSDTLIHDAECKSELIKYLLKLHDEEKLTDSFRIRQYENLNHPHIANQLQLYIDDDTKSTNARDIAIDIARACNIGTLGNSFVEIALNDREHKRLRINAALAVVQIADEDDKARLKSLVTREDLQGDRDDLKGLALKAVWPNHITVSEVFDSLTQPKSKVIGGRYQDFIARDLGEKLRKEDLSTALKWLGKQKTRRGLLYPFSLLSDKIMLKSWEHLEDLNILENFAKIAILRLSHYDDIIQSKNYDNDGYNKKTFKELIEIDCDKRRKLIQKIVDLIPSSENEPLWLNSYRTKIILNDDFVWLVECLRKSKTDNQRKVWSSILYQQFDWGTYNHAGLILEYSETIPSLKEQFSDYIDSINLDSERAEECKNSYFRTQEITNGRDELARPLLEPPPQKRILDLLDRFESGETEAWWRICREMTLLLTSTHYHASIKPDLMLLPGWKEANEKTRLRIIEAAKTYLIQEQTPTEQYLEYKGTYNDADLAVYKALLLVLKIEPDFINVIDGTRWKKWIPSILDYPGATDDSNIRFHEILVRKAYENASDEFIWVLHILIDYQNKQHGCIYIYSLINKLWDRKLADAMMNKIKDSSLAAKSIESLLEQLLRHNIEEARIFAESLISSSPPNTEQEREKVIVAAKALLIYAEDASWNLVWSVIQRDPKLGKDILESVSYFAEMDNRLEQRL